MIRKLRFRAAALMAGALVVELCPMTAGAAPGDAESSFKPRTAEPTSILSVAPYGKHQVIVGGNSINLSGDWRSGLVRFNADGAVDRGFDPRIDGTVSAVVVQEDGLLLVGGRFLKAGEKRRQHLVWLNEDGTLITSPPIWANEAIQAMAVQVDGKIIVTGEFTEIGRAQAGGRTRKGVARLNADGTLDESFKPQVSSTFACAAVQADGKVLIAGDLKKAGDERPLRIARLNADGTLDPDFHCNDDPSFGGQMMCLTVQADGQILIGGGFSTLGGQPNKNLARLHADGSPDAEFNPRPDGAVYSMVAQADGKILIGGEFNQVAGAVRHRVARLEASGSLDLGFSAEADDVVFGLMAQGNGKVVIGGIFDRVGAAEHNALAQLENDPATQSLTVSSVERVQWQRGGSAAETLQVSFELSTDGGGTYRLLGRGSRMNGGWELSGLALPDVGKVRARARTTGGYMNGSSGLVETEVAYSFLAPQIVLKGNGAVIAGRDAAPSLVNGTDFGSGGIAGVVVHSFTIENPGNLELNLTGTPKVVVEDAHMEEFVVTSAPTGPVPPGGSTTFEITYRPRVRGRRTAVVSISNDASGDTPFRFRLQGLVPGASGNLTTPPAEAWRQVINGPGNGTVGAVAVTTDPSGNVITTGTAVDGSNYGYYTVKHTAGGTLVWAQRFDRPDNNRAYPTQLALDSSGNVIVTGTLYNGSNEDFYTVKYAAADGAVLWDKRYDGEGNSAESSPAMAVDGEDNVIIGGTSGPSSSGGATLVKYAAADGAVLWKWRYDRPPNGSVSFGGLALYGNGDVFMALTSSGGVEEGYYTTRHATADGAVLWEKRSPRGNGDATVGVDAFGNSVLIGNVYADRTTHVLAVKRSPDGTLIWEKQIDGTLDLSAGVAVEPGGDVTFGGRQVRGRGYTAKLAAADGAVMWQEYNDFTTDRPRRLVLDPGGNVAVSGNQGGNLRIIAYDGNDGSIIWQDGGSSSPVQSAAALTCDPAGNVIAAGTIANGSSTAMLIFKLASAVALPRIALEQAGATLPDNGRRNLGSVHLGGTAVRSFSIKNIGAAGLELTGMPKVGVSGADAGAFQVSGQTVSPLAAGEETGFDLNFHPQRRGGHVATVSIGNSDGGEVPFRFQVQAAATLASGDLTAAPTEVWSQSLDGASHGADSAVAVVTDTSGNVIVAGNSHNGGNDDYCVAKYAGGDGTLMWDSYAGASDASTEGAASVAVDTYGNVVVTGTSSHGSEVDYYTVKYAGATGAVLWEKRYTSPGNPINRAEAVAVDGAGNVIVGGVSGTEAFCDFCTVKYAAADGAVLWERRHGSHEGSRVVNGLAVDRNGEVLISGYQADASGMERYTARYAASDGAVLWEKRSAGGDSGALGLDAGGNALTIGHGAIPGAPPRQFIEVAKYAVNGAPVWERRRDSGHDGMRGLLAVDGGGNVVIDRRDAQSGYLAKLDAAHGTVLWEQPHSFPAGRPRALLVDPSGNVAVIDSQGGDIRTTAYDGGDGSLIWQNTNGAQSSVARAAAAMARDPAGNVIVAGTIANASADLLVFKLSSAVSLPRLALEVGFGSLADNGTVDFNLSPAHNLAGKNIAAANLLHLGTSGQQRTSTVRNIGPANLTGLTIIKSGAHAADFTVTGPPVTALSPGGSTTFTVRFVAGGAGARAAELHVSSDDAFQSPLKINLTGPGNP